MNPIEKLIKELSKLPGIGEKSATRLAYHLMNERKEDAIGLADAIKDVKERIRFCSECFNLSEMSPCKICSDSARDRSTVCIVETPQDALAIEKTRAFGGVYHILHGAISPLDGVGPDEIRISELEERIKSGQIKEVVIATNPTVEGEATSLYIQRLLKPLGVRTTRIAFGIPFGGDIEYTDRPTLSRALESRTELKS